MTPSKWLEENASCAAFHALRSRAECCYVAGAARAPWVVWLALTVTKSQIRVEEFEC